MAKLLKEVKGEITEPVNSNITLFKITGSVILENNGIIDNNIYLIQNYTKVLTEANEEKPNNFGLKTTKQLTDINISY